MVEVPQYFQKKLHPDEELILFVRPFGLVYTGWFLMSAVLLLGALYYFFHLLRFGYFGMFIFVFVFLLGFFSLVKTLVVWRLTAVVVTNKRIIDFDQHGLFVRQLSEAPLINVQDITLSQKGVWELLFNFGTIKIQTAGTSAVLELSHIRYPRRVHEILVELKEQVNSQSKTQTNDWSTDPQWQAFLQVLEKKKQEIGEKNVKEALAEWLKKED